MAQGFELHRVLETELDRLLQWMRSAESKIALVLPLSTAMLGVLAVLTPRLSDWTILGALSAAFSAVLLFLSIGFCSMASFPRVSGPKGSLVFFGGIATRDSSQYKRDVIGSTEDDYVADLINQCHRNAVIVQAKYKWIQYSLASLFLAAIPWSVSVFVLYVEGA